MATDDGGPAFPGGDGIYAGGPSSNYGMSLRDWFAGMAMQGLLAAGDTMTVAGHAYLVADAMLEARK